MSLFPVGGSAPRCKMDTDCIGSTLSDMSFPQVEQCDASDQKLVVLMKFRYL
jgi:hypothetical protein